MNSYEGGLAQQSVTHFYGGAGSTPKRQMVKKKKKKKLVGAARTGSVAVSTKKKGS